MSIFHIFAKKKFMKSDLVFTFLGIIICGTLFSQSMNIDVTTLDRLRSDYGRVSGQDKAVRNALTNNDIRTLALNRDIAGKADHNFKYRVSVKGITDQKSSGRCWMFTGLNALRPQIIGNKDLAAFEFSTNYLYFWDILEKSNLFMNSVLQHADKPMDDKTVEWLFKNVVGDGGVWNSFANLVVKYGLVPSTVMPETYHSNNTSWLVKLLNRKLREDGLALREMKIAKTPAKRIKEEQYRMLSEVYRMLVLFLGEPPTEFTYRFVDKNDKTSEYKSYTPQSFFAEMFPDYNVDDYYMLMNDPSREYYKVYEIEYDRNVVEGKNWRFLNLPSDELKRFALASIKADEALYTSCDVAKQLSKKDGTLDVGNFDYESLLGMSFGMNKEQRIKTFDSGSSHAMLLMAVDTDNDDKPTKWQFENSWGSSYGHNGYLTFSDKWFDEYMFRIVVNKKFLDDKTLQLCKQKSIMLPPWDPMFAQDEFAGNRK